MRDPRKLEGPFLFVPLDGPPITMVLPLVDRLNRIHDMLDARKFYVGMDAIGRDMIWMIMSDDPGHRLLPLNPNFKHDSIHGAVFFCGFKYEPLTRAAVQRIRVEYFE